MNLMIELLLLFESKWYQMVEKGEANFFFLSI